MQWLNFTISSSCDKITKKGNQGFVKQCNISIFLQMIMRIFGNRIEDEKRTVGVMIEMYCEAHHESGSSTLCKDCTSLLDYALTRIDICTFGIDKPSCEKCPVHCYKKEQREDIKKIMRYSGPRMLFSYPILTIKHLIRNRKTVSTIT